MSSYTIRYPQVVIWSVYQERKLLKCQTNPLFVLFVKVLFLFINSTLFVYFLWIYLITVLYTFTFFAFLDTNKRESLWVLDYHGDVYKGKIGTSSSLRGIRGVMLILIRGFKLVQNDFRTLMNLHTLS